MDQVHVVEGGLARLARGALDVADDVERTRGSFGHGAGDLGEIADTHAALARRWTAGLVVAAAAVVELSDEIRSCEAAYAAQDADAAVTFAGLDR